MTSNLSVRTAYYELGCRDAEQRVWGVRGLKVRVGVGLEPEWGRRRSRMVAKDLSGRKDRRKVTRKGAITK